MKKAVNVILLEDIANVGQRNDLKSVKFGFAKNWLIPKKFAALATPRVLAKIAQKQARAIRTSEQEAEKFQTILADLKNFTLVMRPKKTVKGTLYAGIDAAKIVEALKKKKIVMTPEMIQIKKPIKKVGKYEIPIILLKDVKGLLKLEVK